MDTFCVLLILLFLIIIFHERQFMENMIGFGRGFPDVGDERVYPNRFDAAPYGPYPWADPQWA